jgi:hypothetical protein
MSACTAGFDCGIDIKRWLLEFESSSRDGGERAIGAK